MTDETQEAPREHSKFFTQPSMAKQSMAKECDINSIMKRYEKTGVLEHVREYQGKYGDFTGAVDFATAMQMVREAEAMFLTIPASIRARFNNDPGTFLEFATNAENGDEMRDLGLLPPAPKNDVPEGGEAQGGSPTDSPPEPSPQNAENPA